jgi:hypothetical protein
LSLILKVLHFIYDDLPILLKSNDPLYHGMTPSVWTFLEPHYSWHMLKFQLSTYERCLRDVYMHSPFGQGPIEDLDISVLVRRNFALLGQLKSKGDRLPVAVEVC